MNLKNPIIVYLIIQTIILNSYGVWLFDSLKNKTKDPILDEEKLTLKASELEEFKLDEETPIVEPLFDFQFVPSKSKASFMCSNEIKSEYKDQNNMRLTKVGTNDESKENIDNDEKNLKEKLIPDNELKQHDTLEEPILQDPSYSNITITEQLDSVEYDKKNLDSDKVLKEEMDLKNDLKEDDISQMDSSSYPEKDFANESNDQSDINVSEEKPASDAKKVSTVKETKPTEKAKTKSKTTEMEPIEENGIPESCDEDEIMLPLARFKIVSPEKIIELLASYNLETACNRVQFTIDRVRKSIKACKGFPKDHLYKKLCDGLEKFSKTICTKVKKGKKNDLLSNNECYTQILCDLIDCEGPPDWFEKKDKPHVCRTYVSIANCNYIKAAQFCGLKAAKALRKFSDTIMRQVVSYRCRLPWSLPKLDNSMMDVF